MVKVLYKLFLAVMIALFFGFGVAVFYQAPKAPEYVGSVMEKDPNNLTAEQQKQRDDFDVAQKSYEKDFAEYNRNVSAIIIGISVLILIVSLTLLIQIEIIGDGVLLGGLFTLIYGMIRGLMSMDSRYQFGIVTLGLLIALSLGYIKFIRPEKKANN